MERYFESLESQTFKDFEVIIVDDCSTDGSFEKLQEYVKGRSLPVTLLQSEKNSGPGNARNMGLDVAKGEVVTFIDSDDWVVPDFLERVERVIESEKVNCVIYDYFTWRDGKIGVAKSMYTNVGGKKTLSDCVTSVRNHTVGKFYKLSECRNVRFPMLRRCEDVAYVCQAVVSCGSVYYLNEPLYYYRQRPSSLSNNKQLDESDLLKAFGILEETIGRNFPDELKEKSVCDKLYGVLLIMCKAKKSGNEIRQYIRQYEKDYPEWWKCEIINYVGYAKRVFLMFARLHFILGLKLVSFLHSQLIKKGA